MERANQDPGAASIRVQVSTDTVSTDALLKTCYWFSRDFVCQIEGSDRGYVTAILIPKIAGYSDSGVQADFLSMATDFALRERVQMQTKGIRELLLAKAFSEAGVLEDSPDGMFGDRIEEEKPDGLFKILRNT